MTSKITNINKKTCLIILKILAAVFSYGWISAYSETLFDSTSNPVFDYDSVTDGVVIQSSFSTLSDPVELTKLTLKWVRKADDRGVVLVTLLADNSGFPGATIEIMSLFDVNAYPVTQSWLILPINKLNPLLARTRYWIEIRASSAAGAIAYSRQHKGVGVIGEAYKNMYGLNQNVKTGPYILRLEANRIAE